MRLGSFPFFLAARGFLLVALLALFPLHVLSQGDSTVVRVVRVVDGDTIEICCLAGLPEGIRYIGINAPETHQATKGAEAYAKEAAEANAKLVAGKLVRLEFDERYRDRDGRILAYVYLQDGTFVNAWLVEQGYAQMTVMPPNVKHQELFLKLQREAREAGRGLWK